MRLGIYFIAICIGALCGSSRVLAQVWNGNLANPPVLCVEEAVRDSVDSDKSDFDPEKLKDFQSPEFDNQFLRYSAIQDPEEKIKTIYEAADAEDMPPTMLAGALMQESSLADLGLSEDFGNWSCGIGQLNVIEWCDWARTASPELKKKIHWPESDVAQYLMNNPTRDICSGEFLRVALAKPFHEIALSRLRADGVNRSEIMLTHEQMINPRPIQYSEVSAEMERILAMKVECKHSERFNDECLKIGKSVNEMQASELRYLITKNFVENCSNFHFGIHGRAHALRRQFDTLPDEVKKSQQYTGHNSFPRQCERVGKSKSYPLGIGWMLAEASYNAGDELLPGIFAYVKENHLHWENVGPQLLVNAINASLESGKISKKLAPIANCEAHFHLKNTIGNILEEGHEVIAKEMADVDADDCDTWIRTHFKNGKLIRKKKKVLMSPPSSPQSSGDAATANTF